MERTHEAWLWPPQVVFTPIGSLPVVLDGTFVTDNICTNVYLPSPRATPLSCPVAAQGFDTSVIVPGIGACACPVCHTCMFNKAKLTFLSSVALRDPSATEDEGRCSGASVCRVSTLLCAFGVSQLPGYLPKDTC